MNLKIFFIIFTLSVLFIAELFSYISSQLWTICSSHSPLSEQYNRKKLNNIYFFIEKTKSVFYVFFLISVLITFCMFLK